MSRLTVPCDTIPTGDTILTGKDKHGNDIEIKVSDLSKQPEVDVCNTIESCPKIKALDSKDAQLQAQIKNLNDKIEKSDPITNNPNDKGIKQRLDEAEACCEDLHEKLNDNEQILREVNDNISILKSWNIRQDEVMKGIKRDVIIDNEYLNFEEWVENVYLPNADALVNKWSIGDTYINVTGGLVSKNSYYINIRKPDSKEPPSANDWIKVPCNDVNDLISIIGIDPIVVDRPGKHNWTVSIDPNKLADMLGKLPSLDLSKVDVSLGEIHFDPIFKEDATIEESLNVGATTTTKDLNVKDTAVIEKACIKEMVCDTEYKGTPTFNHATFKGTVNLKHVNQQGGNFHINGPHVRIEGDSVEIPEIEGDTRFRDVVIAPEININHNTTTATLNVEHESVFNGHMTINGPFQYVDKENPEAKPVCMDNVAKNLFRPSFGMFKLVGTGYISDQTRTDPVANSVVFGLGSDAVATFNNAQPGRSPLVQVGNPGNSTSIIRENEDYATPSVYLDKGSNHIIIDGSGEDAGIYRIDFGCTMRFNDLDGAPYPDFTEPESRTTNNQGKNNMESVRSGIVVYTADNITQGGYIIDDKHHRYEMQYMREHDHEYYDSDSYGSSTRRRTSKVRFRHPMHHIPENDKDLHLYQYNKAAEWYTFTRSMLVKIDSKAVIAPYLKVASFISGMPVNGGFVIADGKWNSGSNSQISIQKIANLGTPYEYHC